MTPQPFPDRIFVAMRLNAKLGERPHWEPIGERAMTTLEDAYYAVVGAFDGEQYCDLNAGTVRVIEIDGGVALDRTEDVLGWMVSVYENRSPKDMPVAFQRAVAKATRHTRIEDAPRRGRV